MKKVLTDKEKEMLRDYIEIEGFDEAILYSDYNDIDDNEFHELRDKYLEIRAALYKYVGADA